MVTSSLKIRVWKSSSLAVLAFGLNDEAKASLLQDGSTLEGVEEKAKDFPVLLSKEGGQLVLVSAH
jgi:hypothetical protein